MKSKQDPWYTNDYQQGRWDMFETFSTIEYGKQCYFLQDNGIVYSRRTGKHMSFDDAINEFCNSQGWDC